MKCDYAVQLCTCCICGYTFHNNRSMSIALRRVSEQLATTVGEFHKIDGGVEESGNKKYKWRVRGL